MEKPKSQERILYRVNLSYGDGFFNPNGDLISYIHDDDGRWEDIYFRDILSFFDGNVVYLGDIEPEDVGLSNDECEELYFENTKVYVDKIKQLIDESKNDT